MGWFKSAGQKTQFEDILHDYEDQQSERQRNSAKKSRGAKAKKPASTGFFGGAMCTRDFNQIKESLKR